MPLQDIITRRLVKALQESHGPLSTFSQPACSVENDDKDHEAYSIAGQWFFGPLDFVKQERLSLLLSYEYGESAPTFKKKDVTEVALGLKF